MIRPVRSWIVAALCLFVALSFPGGCALLPAESLPEREAVVTRVVDGDTVEISPPVRGEEDVRLIGVDAPELHASGGPQPYARRAAAFAERRLEGRRVRLEFDAELEDPYGRILAYVYAGEEMFNRRLLERGYAQLALFPPNTLHAASLRRAQREAREARRGLWGLPPEELCRLADRGNGIGGGC
ncbi:thermonuclease [Rubrobacter xylanophilus]|uniref:Thermonuclease n=1 Tax=Rubrobacter xylanophilus TaxID=49319 RepID=A0A510HJM6_9ACTN|nr:thermonuclease family protein [Rubrobacter xylanophilus]BBL79475.1 thermonuclease [Rubrobacter xylanophilus]